MFKSLFEGNNPKEITVRYMVFPDIEDGVSGFYANGQDSGCVEPTKPYSSGVCHTLGHELDEIALKAGFQTREEFAADRESNGHKNWKNAYGKELSSAVGKMLEIKGIEWEIDGEKLLFQCAKGEFTVWPRGR
ncbi:hypothetical protein CEF21_21500 [Bacillus sp. FJAT-42376]|uniref:hypothetical protein n=1 Tax=Bacillus sp. FJAT-42376 TaxID=2014076 RepID=UPI000F4E6EFC|nr:hypothetical protein [Bacillus sp. FJAT-42376]AZB44657.1 hypothetical protein CEF21_21500 [Bacillus sp. FJAT-42376]